MPLLLHTQLEVQVLHTLGAVEACGNFELSALPARPHFLTPRHVDDISAWCCGRRLQLSEASKYTTLSTLLRVQSQVRCHGRRRGRLLAMSGMRTAPATDEARGVPKMYRNPSRAHQVGNSTCHFCRSFAISAFERVYGRQGVPPVSHSATFECILCAPLSCTLAETEAKRPGIAT